MCVWTAVAYWKKGLLDQAPLISQVCYSFWVLSALSILKKVPWIDAEKLTEFILSAQVCAQILMVLSPIKF
jgi:geranylgeranyl transferase type-2 subunit beta